MSFIHWYFNPTLICKPVWSYRGCGHSSDMKAPDGLASQGARWIVAGMIRCQPQYPLTTSPRSCVTVARYSSYVISTESWALGFAGAVTADACILCAAGTYQTGSGPPRQHCLPTHCILINQLDYDIIPYE